MSRVGVSAAALGLAALGAVALPERWLWFVAIGVTAVSVLNVGFDMPGILAIARAETRGTPLAAATRSGPAALDPAGLLIARQRVESACQDGQLPPEVWERLVVASLLRFDDIGIDIDNPRAVFEAEAMVSDELWQLIRIEPDRGGEVRAQATASSIIKALDELEQLSRTRSTS